MEWICCVCPLSGLDLFWWIFFRPSFCRVDFHGNQRESQTKREKAREVEATGVMSVENGTAIEIARASVALFIGLLLLLVLLVY